MLLVSVVCSSYSYCEIVHGSTQNAAADAQQWVMTNVLPQYMGLTVGSVSYQYTVVKTTQDDMVVTVQNKQAGSDGLVFQSADNWSGVPGNSIRKTVAVNNIEGINWGDGEIAIQGYGSVINPNVQYNYSYDPCVGDPLFSPSCPGYAAAYAKTQLDKVINVSYDLIPETTTEYETQATKLPEYYEEETGSKKSAKELDDEDNADRKKRGLRSAANALTEANALSQQQILDAMNFVPAFQSYYDIVMSGGVYADATMYKPTNIPENRSALKVGLTQQLLHEKMVEQQYKK